MTLYNWDNVQSLQCNVYYSKCAFYSWARTLVDYQNYVTLYNGVTVLCNVYYKRVYIKRVCFSWART